MLLEEYVTANSSTTVFPVDAAGDPHRRGAMPIVENDHLHGQFGGVYVQDEWIIIPKLTLNVGVRWDDFNSSFDNENQFSPRANLIWQPFDATTMHIGYSRYFHAAAGGKCVPAGPSYRDSTARPTLRRPTWTIR